MHRLRQGDEKRWPGYSRARARDCIIWKEPGKAKSNLFLTTRTVRRILLVMRRQGRYALLNLYPVPDFHRREAV